MRRMSENVWFFSASYGMFKEGAQTTLARVQTLEEQQRKGERGFAGEQEIPLWALKFSSTVTGRLLAVIPDFGEIDPTVYLVEEIDIPLAVLAWRWLVFSPFWIIPVLIGVLLLHLREFS